MIKHKSMCEQVKKTMNDNSTSIQQYFRPTITQFIPRKLKEKVTTAIVEFVSLDNRAVELIARGRFVHLVQTIFEAGQDLYRLHVVNVLNVLLNSRTVSTFYSKKRLSLCTQKVSTLLESGSMSGRPSGRLHDKSSKI
jgi:hypothetical protein